MLRVSSAPQKEQTVIRQVVDVPGTEDIRWTTDIHGPSDVRDMYIADPKELRKDYGCTPERLRTREALYVALCDRLQNRREDPIIEACIDELRACLRRVDNGLGISPP